MPSSEAQKRASAKYNKNNTRLITIRLMLSSDADILNYLDSLPNKQGYIKSLIRADMARAKSENMKEDENMETTKSAAQVMTDNYAKLIDEMTIRYRNVLESDGNCQYQVYIWEDGEVECLCGPQGDSSRLVARSNEPRNLYYVTTISAPCVDVFDIAGAERPEDPAEEEAAKAEAIDWLVDNYSDEAEARLNNVIEQAQED